MTDNKIYHIDKVRINSKKSIGFLKEKLPIDKLQKESKNFIFIFSPTRDEEESMNQTLNQWLLILGGCFSQVMRYCLYEVWLYLQSFG